MSAATTKTATVNRTTSTAATKTASPATPAPKQEQEEIKSFTAMSPKERHEHAVQKLEALLKDPIFRINFEPLREVAIKRGATNISRTGGPYFQFKGAMPAETYLLCQVMYGQSVTMKQVDRYDENKEIYEFLERMKQAENKRNVWDQKPDTAQHVEKATPAPIAKSFGNRNFNGERSGNAGRRNQQRGRGGRGRGGRGRGRGNHVWN